MTGISIQLHRLAIGRNQVDGRQMAPVHKQRVEKCLSQSFSKQPNIDFTCHQNQTTPFRLNLKKKVVDLNGAEIALEQANFKAIRRVAGYYQHVGLLPRPTISPKEAVLRERTTQAAVSAMYTASIPGTNGKILAGVQIGESTLSLTRNILYAIPVIGRDHPLVNHLGYYVGVLWSYFAVQEVMGAIKDLKRAKTIGDKEGKARAHARLTSGGIVSTASNLYLAGRVCDTLGSTKAAIMTLGLANIFFGIGTLLSVGMSYLGWTRCHNFNERLNEYLENPNLSEVTKLQGALLFLKDAISVTPDEIANLKAKIQKEHPLFSQNETESRLKEDLTKLTEIKVKYLKRRTSTRSLQMILNQIDPLLIKLDNANTKAVGIKEAALLIHKIQNENRTKMSLFILSLIAAIISVAGLFAMIFMTAGALPFVLYGIAGAIFLSIEIYNTVGLFRRKESGQEVVLYPITDIVPIALN